MLQLYLCVLGTVTVWDPAVNLSKEEEPDISSWSVDGLLLGFCAIM